MSLIGILIASFYPFSMGVRVITDMITNGVVDKKDYPKYIIPYTPISIAIIIGIIVLPLCIKLFKKFSILGGVAISSVFFFVSELLFEKKVVVSSSFDISQVEDWQMFMCYRPDPIVTSTTNPYKPQTAVEILMGDYNPLFKLHFYLISIVLIVTILNCFYGFGQLLLNNDKKRLKSLVLQSICSASFLGLCILACFTAFWRDGSIQVSSLSATLMTIFFVLFGITVGVFTGSFLLGKKKSVSVLIPAIIASMMTLLMYIGEMILLNGHLYKFGVGALFDSIPGIVLAPIDLVVLVITGGITALLFILLNRGTKTLEKGIS